MIEPVFFDADLLSSFFWVGKQYLLIRLYKDRIFIPERVIFELNRVSQFKKIYDSLSAQKQICKAEILIGTPEFELYNKLICKPEPGYKVIGQGEAAAISLAKCRNGIVGSNNLNDIMQYITMYNIRFVTTASILEEVLNQGLINERDGNQIWHDMSIRRITLPYNTFTDYLRLRKKT